MKSNDDKIEAAVIGAILLEPFCLPKVITMLIPECFSVQKHREIYKAILNLDKKREVIDILTVTQELNRMGVLKSIGGSYEVAVMTNGVFSSLHTDRHAAFVYQYFVLRETAKIAMKVYNLCQEPQADALEIMQIAQRDLSGVDYISKGSFRQVGDVVIEILDENRKIIETGIKPGLTTGLDNIDKFFRKQKQDFGVVAARPGMGKTAYMLANAKHTAMVLQKPVLIFSLEMSTKKLVGRLMASESGVISSKAINEKSLNSEELMTLSGGVQKLLDVPIYFDDTPALTIMEMKAKIRRAVQEFGIVEVYIDYLQLMGGERKGNREQEISYISRQLKITAKEEDIPITAFSQLSREVERRPDKKPNLSDLRESGAIEQDADWVFFLMRPEYYGLGDERTGLYTGDTFNGGRNLPAEHLMIVDCAKYREGALFKAALRFYGQFMKIENYDTDTLAGIAAPPLTPLQPNTDFTKQPRDFTVPVAEQDNNDLPF